MNKSRFWALLFVAALGTASLPTDAFAAGHGGGGGHFGGDGSHFGGGGGRFGGGGHFGGGGGHFGGGHFGGGHFGGGFGDHRHFGRSFFVPFSDDGDWGDYSYNDADCWQYERVPTQVGWRWREVWVCG
jgi:hypothetical protein